MSIFKNALSASLGLEDDAPNVQVNIDTDEAGMPIDNVTDLGENTPEADEVEIIEDAQEIEADNEVIEEMNEAAESLESIYLAMESAQVNGGLTPEAAAMASLAVNNIVRKYNVTSEQMGISLESFNDNRVLATTVSMEGVGSALRDLWDMIVTKFQEMVKKIVDFYHKTIAAAPRIKRRAESIRKKARANTGSPKEKTMKVGLYSSLNIRGNIPSSSELQAALKQLAGDVVTHRKKTDIQNEAKAIFASFEGAGENGGANGVAAALKNKMGFTGFAGGPGTYKLSGTSANYKVGGTPASVVLVHADKLPGNKMIFAGTVTSNGRASRIEAFNDFRAGIYTDDDSVKSDKAGERDKEWPVLSTSDIETLCDLIIKNMDVIIAEKTQADKKLNSVKLTKAEGEKLIRKIDGDTKAKGQAEANKALKIVVDVMRNTIQGEAQIVSYSYRTSKAVLSYCARSLGQYKKD